MMGEILGRLGVHETERIQELGNVSGFIARSSPG
jgi:hypothetical protein